MIFLLLCLVNQFLDKLNYKKKAIGQNLGQNIKQLEIVSQDSDPEPDSDEVLVDYAI